jgi:hypothetical protein
MEGRFQFINPTFRRLIFDADTKVFQELEAAPAQRLLFRKFQLANGTQVQLTSSKDRAKLTISLVNQNQ